MNRATRTVRCGRLFLMLSLLAALALSAAPAQAKRPVTVHCGQTLTHSVKMANDLTNCPNNGLLIGADNITLDLNGHTIDGDDQFVENCGPDESCDVGVDNTAGHNRVTIKGGKVRGFAVGVFVLGVSDNRLRHLSSSNNFFIGIFVIESTLSQVERNSTNDNGSPSEDRGSGIVLIASHNIRIERNSVSGNGDGGMFVGGSDSNRIAHNSVSGNSFAGIVTEGDGNEVSHNRLHRNDDNMIVSGNRNRVTANEITDAVGCPDEERPGELACGKGISVEGGDGNLVADNRVARAVNDTITVDSFDPDNPTVGTVVRDNLARDAGVDGISVGTAGEGAVTDTLILHNKAIGAGDDGIDVESAATTLTRNWALRNHDLGIEAVPGVTDGGGNRAAGNGNPLQCTNVFCR